jgi:hypothetical protein
MTPVGTIWRRAVRRVIRRSELYRGDPSAHHELLLREACRLANGLAR